jgi:hypothetical protein
MHRHSTQHNGAIYCRHESIIHLLNSSTMNTSTTSQLSKFILIAVVTLSGFALSSCAKKANFLTSAVVPAARGNVTVTSDKNKNYVIKLQLSNLSEVDRLQPAKNAYVVWMVTDQGSTKNLGQISSSSGLMSSKLKGTFETVSPLKPVRVFITAENDPVVQYPGNMVVLTTDKF